MPFISKTLQYSFYACVRNILKIVTFVIEKMKLVSFSVFPKTVLNPPVIGKIQGHFKALRVSFPQFFKANLIFKDF